MMGNTVYILGLAILATALVVLLVFGSGGTVGGIDAHSFARFASLAAIAVLVGAAVVGRGAPRPKLWHAAVWLALLVALMAGYQAFA
jgi:hypothetical protein